MLPLAYKILDIMLTFTRLITILLTALKKPVMVCSQIDF